MGVISFPGRAFLLESFQLFLEVVLDHAVGRCRDQFFEVFGRGWDGLEV